MSPSRRMSCRPSSCGPGGREDFLPNRRIGNLALVFVRDEHVAHGSSLRGCARPKAAASSRQRPYMIRRQAAIRHSTGAPLSRGLWGDRAAVGRANAYPDRPAPGRRRRPHGNFADAVSKLSFARMDAHFCLMNLEKGVMGGRIDRPVADGVQAREGYAIRERLYLMESLAELQFFDDGRGHCAASGPPRDSRLARTSRNRDPGPLEFRPRTPQEMRR